MIDAVDMGPRVLARMWRDYEQHRQSRELRACVECLGYDGLRMVLYSAMHAVWLEQKKDESTGNQPREE